MVEAFRDRDRCMALIRRDESANFDERKLVVEGWGDDDGTIWRDLYRVLAMKLALPKLIFDIVGVPRDNLGHEEIT